MGKDLRGKELGKGLTQRKDGKYSARFTKKDGKRLEKLFEKRKEAEKWLYNARVDDQNAGLGNGKTRVDEWFCYWIDKIKRPNIKDNTYYHYKTLYERFAKTYIGDMCMEDVKPIHCREIIETAKMSSEKESSGHLANIVLTAMFSDAVKDSIIEKNPMENVKTSQNSSESVALSMAEQRMLLEEVKGEFFYDLILFDLNTGLRMGELSALTWDDVDFQNRTITINKTFVVDIETRKVKIGTPKTKNSYRTIPMTDIAYDCLVHQKFRNASLKKIKTEYDNLVFYTKTGKVVQSANMFYFLKKSCYNCGIDRISMHTLRHTFATRCIESGMKPKTLQMILGHSSVSTTLNLYVHVSDNDKQNSMKTLNQFMMAI